MCEREEGGGKIIRKDKEALEQEIKKTKKGDGR